MNRRNFLKDSCKLCLLGNFAMAISSAPSCKPAAAQSLSADIINNTISIPIALFQSKEIVIITPRKYEYEIAVVKMPDTTYRALLLKCTHYDNQVTHTGNTYTCTAHGSKFDKKGDVLNGPAAAPLQQLTTQLSNNHIVIHL